MPRMEKFVDAEMVVYTSDPPTRRTREVDAGQEVAIANLNRRHVPLTIVAQDPSVTSPPGAMPLTVEVDVPTEPLQPGPRGHDSLSSTSLPGAVHGAARMCSLLLANQ